MARDRPGSACGAARLRFFDLPGLSGLWKRPFQLPEPLVFAPTAKRMMTRIFLNDEVDRAEQKKLDGLTRELKKIRKKDYARI